MAFLTVYLSLWIFALKIYRKATNSRVSAITAAYLCQRIALAKNHAAMRMAV